jgi:hypothetical protein
LTLEPLQLIEPPTQAGRAFVSPAIWILRRVLARISGDISGEEDRVFASSHASRDEMLRGEHPARRQREEPAGTHYCLFKGLINMAKAVEELAEDSEKSGARR